MILGVQRCRGDVTTPRYVFTGSALLTRILRCWRHEAYAWSRQANMVDELNNPITKYQYITSLDMVNALKNHISISSQSYADVMIYLPSFSETYPFYASFNGIGFVHDYIDVPLELSKIGKTISAVDASTLVNSFIIRFPFADGYTYSATLS